MEGDTNMSSEIRCTRFLLATVLALGAFGVSAPVALALPPSNDTFAGATPVAVGFTEVLATTEATTDADDVLSVTATTDAAPGTYQIKVTTLASASRSSWTARFTPRPLYVRGSRQEGPRSPGTSLFRRRKISR